MLIAVIVLLVLAAGVVAVVAWPLVRERTVETTPPDARRLALLGIKSMRPEQALSVMERLLRETATQVVALPINWRQYHEFYPAGTEPALLAELGCEEAASPMPASQAGTRRSQILEIAR
jgi:hypothetical protein